VTLRLSEDHKVVRIWAEGPTIQGTLKGADAAKGTVTATIAMTKGEPATDKIFVLTRSMAICAMMGPALGSVCGPGVVSYPPLSRRPRSTVN
jgi:hypothetical protein